MDIKCPICSGKAGIGISRDDRNDDILVVYCDENNHQFETLKEWEQHKKGVK